MKKERKRKKKKEQADLTQLDGGEDNEWRWRCWRYDGGPSRSLSLSDVKQM